MKIAVVALCALGGCSSQQEKTITQPQQSNIAKQESNNTVDTRYFVYFYRYPTDNGYSHGQYGAWSTKGAPSFAMVDKRVAEDNEGVDNESVDITGFIEVNKSDFICLFRESISTAKCNQQTN